METDVVRADIRYSLTLSELAEAHRVARRAAWPKRTLLADIFSGVLATAFLLASAFFLSVAVEHGADEISPSSFGSFAFALVWVFAFSTPGRAWLVAAAAFAAVRRESRDVTLSAFSASTLWFRTKDASSDIAHRGFPIHVETERLFVIATAGAVPACAVPKRAFTDGGVMSSFRALVMREGSPAIANAMQAFDETDEGGGVEYMPDVDEQLRAGWLLLVHTSPRATQLIMLAAVLAVPVYVASNFDLPAFVLATIVVTGSIWLGRQRARERTKALLRPVRFFLDERGLRARSENGVIDVTWEQALGYLEKDPRLMLVIIRPGFGLILPTRAIPEAWFAEVRARSKPYRRA